MECELGGRTADRLIVGGGQHDHGGRTVSYGGFDHGICDDAPQQTGLAGARRAVNRLNLSLDQRSHGPNCIALLYVQRFVAGMAELSAVFDQRTSWATG